MKIYNFRREYICKINNYINDIYKNYDKKGKICLQYISDFKDENKDKILESIKKNRAKEIKIGIALFGIHRDDIIFLYDNYDAREYCSQGIQKLIVLAMKLSEICIFIMIYLANLMKKIEIIFLNR